MNEQVVELLTKVWVQHATPMQQQIVSDALQRVHQTLRCLCSCNSSTTIRAHLLTWYAPANTAALPSNPHGSASNLKCKTLRMCTAAKDAVFSFLAPRQNVVLAGRDETGQSQPLFSLYTPLLLFSK